MSDIVSRRPHAERERRSPQSRGVDGDSLPVRPGEKIRSSAAVRAAIEELGYWPSPTARSLKSGVNYVIGVVVPDITNPFFAAVVKGIEGATRAGPYNIFLCDSDESVRREEEGWPT